MQVLETRRPCKRLEEPILHTRWPGAILKALRRWRPGQYCAYGGGQTSASVRDTVALTLSHAANVSMSHLLHQCNKNVFLFIQIVHIDPQLILRGLTEVTANHHHNHLPPNSGGGSLLGSRPHRVGA